MLGNADVLDIVQGAFCRDIPWGGMGLNEAQAVDAYADESELAEARAQDLKWAQTPWTDVPDEEIFWAYAAHGYLDDASFRFFTPAFLCWSLQNEEGEHRDASLHESIVWAFVGPSGLNQATLRRSPLLFTPVERRAVLAFLKYQAEQERDAVIRDAGTRRTNVQHELRALVEDLCSDGSVYRTWFAACEQCDAEACGER
ncbi:MAG: DUF6714 family protein [Phycisphaerales bacterium]